MNLIDAKVAAVLDPLVKSMNGYWLVKVRVTAYGVESSHVMMCKTLEEAENVKVGDTVQI